MRIALGALAVLLVAGCGRASPQEPPANPRARTLSVCSHLAVSEVARAVEGKPRSMESSGESYDQAQCEYRVALPRAGVDVIDVGIDVASGAAQRLCNQQVERSQFHARGPEAPETIAGVGDDEFRAYWVGAVRQLYATRTGRFLTLRYVPADGSGRRARRNSIRLAKLAFARTADLHPPPGQPPQATC